MPREITVHLSVTVPDGDARSVDEITDALLAAMAEGDNSADGDGTYDVGGLFVVCPLAEEL